MKKIAIWILSVILAFTSCNQRFDYETTITYRIYYPGNTVTRSRTEKTTDRPTYFLGSERGSNYLYFNTDGRWISGYGKKIEDTTAPIEVISFMKRKVE